MNRKAFKTKETYLGAGAKVWKLRDALSKLDKDAIVLFIDYQSNYDNDFGEQVDFYALEDIYQRSKVSIIKDIYIQRAHAISIEMRQIF